jgi:hypothetical protein
VIKRFQPKDRGKAYSIMKRTSHLVVTIDERNKEESDVKQRCSFLICRDAEGTNYGSKGQSNRFSRRDHRGLEEPLVRPQAAFGDFLVEDFKVRKHIDKKLNRKPPFAAVSDILIERTREEVTITLKTARPGLVIGPKGAEVDKLREELEDLIKRKVAPIKVIEIKNPDLNAQLVAEAIAEQLKKRASFRRVLKHADGRRRCRPAPRESRSASAAGSAGRKSPAAKKPPPARFR